MRHVAFFISILFLVSCGNTTVSTANGSFKKQAPDTVLTSIEYAHNPMNNDYRIVTAQKVFKDTFVFVSKDSNTQVKKWLRDSFYIIQLVDSVRDIAGVVAHDSAGKPKMKVVNIMLPKSEDPKKDLLLRDFNKAWNK